MLLVREAGIKSALIQKVTRFTCLVDGTVNANYPISGATISKPVDGSSSLQIHSGKSFTYIQVFADTKFQNSQGGPSARSCHTMCFDPIKKSLYVLGRYVEVRPVPTSGTPDLTPKLYESDFYQYFIDLDQWIKISDNTQVSNTYYKLCYF